MTQEEIKKDVLKDTQTDTKLKDYCKYMINTFGEDYTLATLTYKRNIKDSVETFSSKFDDESDIDLLCSIIKSSVLSNNKTRSNFIVRKLISNGNINELIGYINENIELKSALIKNFMNQCYLSNEQMYIKKDRENNALGNLLSIIYFENVLEQEKEEKKIRVLRK